MIAGVLIFLVFLVVLFWRQLSGAPSPADQTGSIDNAPHKVARWADAVKPWARLYNIPWQVVLAVIWQESWGDPEAIGSAGEVGLMQIKQVAINDLKELGYSVPDDWHTDPESNIAAGTAYLALQRNRTGRLIDAVGQYKADALEAYNEGYAGAKRDVAVDEYSSEVLAKARRIGF